MRSARNQIWYTYIFAFICVFQSSVALGQTGFHLQGRVVNKNGQTIAGVTIKINETDLNTQTDQQGVFHFKQLSAGNYNLTISHIAESTTTYFISIEKDTQVDFTLQSQSKDLAEIVIPLEAAPRANVCKMTCHARELPQTISIVDSDYIKKQQALRLSEVIQNVSGLHLASTRGSAREIIYVRGYIACCDNMFKNGARVPAEVMPEMSSLDRLEVLKGSAAVLYGQVTPGGVINMISKQPQFEKGGSINMRIGSYGLYKPELDLYGPINNQLAYRINGSYEQAESFRAQVNSTRHFINPSLLFRPNKQSEILFQADYLNHQFKPDFGTGAINNIIVDMPRSTYLGALWSNAKVIHINSSISFKHQFNSAWKLQTSINYQRYHKYYQATENIVPQVNGDVDRPFGKYRLQEDRFAGQINLNGKFATGGLKHQLLVGTDAEQFAGVSYTFMRQDPKTKTWIYLNENNLIQSGYDRINIWDSNKFAARSVMPVMNPFDRVETTSQKLGIFVNDMITLSDKLNLLAGLRWSLVQSLPAQTTDLRSQIITQKDGRFDQAFSPRLGLVYKPWAQTSLFASYANSFMTNAARDINSNWLKPSYIDQYEVGVKQAMLRGKLSLEATAYQIVNDNLPQTARFTADGSPNFDQTLKELSGQTKSEGIEVDMNTRLMQGLSVQVAYSYNFMRYTKTPGTPGSYLVNDRVLNIPDHTANLNLWYEFHTGRLKGFVLGTSAKYTGRRLAGYSRTVGGNNQPMSLTSFSTIDFSVGYNYKRFSLLGKVSNMGNTLNYYVHENYSVNPIAPRQFFTTLSYKL